MFIEFDTASGAILLNVRHIVLVKRSRSDGTEIVFANGGSATVTAAYHEVCDSIERLSD
jgi:competence transcription factor ComK